MNDEIKIVLTGDASGAEAALALILKKLNELESTSKTSGEGAGGAVDKLFKRVSDGAAKASEAILKWTAILGGIATGGGLIAATKAAMEYEKALHDVASVSEDVAGNLKAYDAGLKSIASGSSKDLTDITKGMYQAISAGIPATMGAGGALDFLNTAQKAATAGLATVKDAVTVGALAMNTFGSKAGTATEVFDALQTVVSRGVTRFPELASTLGNVSTAASQAGVGFHEMLASVTLLTKGGLDAAKSTDALRALITAINSPTGEAIKLFKALHIEYGTSAIEAKGLGGVVADLIDKTGGSAIALRKLIPDVIGLQAAQILAKDSGRALRDEMDAQSKSAGAVSRAAEQQEKTVTASTERMRNAFKILSSDVFDKDAPQVVEGIDSITAAVKKIDADKIAAGINAIAKALAWVVDVLGSVGREAEGAGTRLGGMVSFLTEGKLSGALDALPPELGYGKMADAMRKVEAGRDAGTKRARFRSGSAQAADQRGINVSDAGEFVTREDNGVGMSDTERAAANSPAFEGYENPSRKAANAKRAEALASHRNLLGGHKKAQVDEALKIDQDYYKALQALRAIDLKNTEDEFSAEIADLGASKQKALDLIGQEADARTRMAEDAAKKRDEEIVKDIKKGEARDAALQKSHETLTLDKQKIDAEYDHRVEELEKKALAREKADRDERIKLLTEYQQEVYNSSASILAAQAREAGAGNIANQSGAYGSGGLLGVAGAAVGGTTGLGLQAAGEMGVGGLLEHAGGVNLGLGAGKIFRGEDGGFGQAAGGLGALAGGAAYGFAANQLGNLVGLAGSTDPSKFGAALQEKFDAAKAFIDNLVKNLPTLFKALAAAVPDLVNGLMDGLIAGFPKIFDAIIASFGPMVGKLIATIVPKIPDLAIAIVTGVIDAFIGNMDKLLVSLSEGIVKAIVKLLDKLTGGAAGAADKFASGDIAGGLSDTVHIGGSLNPLNWATGGIVPELHGAIQSFATGGIARQQMQAARAAGDTVASMLSPGEAVFQAQAWNRMQEAVVQATERGSGGGAVNIALTLRGRGGYDAAFEKIIGQAFTAEARRQGATARTAREVAAPGFVNLPEVAELVSET